MSALRSLAPLRAVPEVIWLAGGLPPASAFPFSSVAVTLADGTPLALTSDEVYACQQYPLHGAGYPPLLAWIAAHVAQAHAPPRPVAHFVTCGSTQVR